MNLLKPEGDFSLEREEMTFSISSSQKGLSMLAFISVSSLLQKSSHGLKAIFEL
jgi:hypothetical protein